jgi:hypothetical protein
VCLDWGSGAGAGAGAGAGGGGGGGGESTTGAGAGVGGGSEATDAGVGAGAGAGGATGRLLSTRVGSDQGRPTLRWRSRCMGLAFFLGASLPYVKMNVSSSSRSLLRAPLPWYVSEVDSLITPSSEDSPIVN